MNEVLETNQISSVKMPRQSGKTRIAVDLAVKHDAPVCVIVPDQKRMLQFESRYQHEPRIFVACANTIVLGDIADYNLIIVDDADQIMPEIFYKHIIPHLQKSAKVRLILLWSPSWPETLPVPIISLKNQEN